MSRKQTERNEGFQAELEDLQRKFRTLETDRKARSDNIGTSGSKAQQQVESLKKDNERLKRELELETRQARLTNSSAAALQVSRMQLQSETYARKIEQERRRCDDYASQIAAARDTMYQMRRTQRGVNSVNEATLQVQKKIRSLENKLDKALIKLNEALTHNKNLRETIENLRRERGVFDGIYKKLEEELGEKKHDMAAIIDLYNEAYEKRDEAFAEMQALKIRADEEQRKFEHEWRQLSTLVQQDRLVKTTTMNTTTGAALSLTNETGKLQGPPNAEPTAVANSEMEVALRRRLTIKNAEIEADREAISRATKRVAEYTAMFEKIKTETHIVQIGDLVQRFVSSEDQNFSLFNYVNDLNHEIEKSEEQLTGLKAEIDRFGNVGEAAPGAVEPRKKKLDSLDQTLARTQAGTTAFEQQQHETHKSLAVLKTGIARIHHMLLTRTNDETASAVTPELDESAVTESNLVQHLAVIEQHTDQLLQAHLARVLSQQQHPQPQVVAAALLAHLVSNTSGKDRNSSLMLTLTAPVPVMTGFGASPPSSSANHHRGDHAAELPTMFPELGGAEEDESDEDDDFDIPLSREELQRRAARDLPDVSKKDKRASAKFRKA